MCPLSVPNDCVSVYVHVHVCVHVCVHVRMPTCTLLVIEGIELSSAAKRLVIQLKVTGPDLLAVLQQPAGICVQQQATLKCYRFITLRLAYTVI